MTHRQDDVVTLVAAALGGILAAKQGKADHTLVCREAVAIGHRTAAALRRDRRRWRLVGKIGRRRRRAARG